MANVYEYVVPQGVIEPDTGVIQTDVQTEFQNAFGSDLIVTPNTPQGILITGEVLARTAAAANNAAVANQINPNLAGGVFLDAIIALTNPAGRTLGTPSTVLVTITGVVGTIIPAGSQASETVTGNIFETISDETIPTGGVLTNVAMQSVVNGPSTCSSIHSDSNY